MGLNHPRLCQAALVIDRNLCIKAVLAARVAKFPIVVKAQVNALQAEELNAGRDIGVDVVEVRSDGELRSRATADARSVRAVAWK